MGRTHIRYEGHRGDGEGTCQIGTVLVRQEGHKSDGNDSGHMSDGKSTDERGRAQVTWEGLM